jgi:23S rRNA pseudouridine2457 synthase
VLLAFHKPYGVLSQFTRNQSAHGSLADFGFPAHVYPLGRLDADSEGLLLLSDEAGLNSRLLDPRNQHRRGYWAQVERVPNEASLEHLMHGVTIESYVTQPCRAWRLDPQPETPARVPPIRRRLNVPDCWIAIELTEGKNRQVRRMTAAIGHPTLRLIRVAIGDFELGSLKSGSWRELTKFERRLVFA